MTFFEIVCEMADVFLFWRVYLCVVPAVVLASFLHYQWPEARWVWLVTVPMAIVALVFGLRWQYYSD
jgi:hypothetical protein